MIGVPTARTTKAVCRAGIGLLALVLGPAQAADVQARDDLGQTISLAYPARRIISLAPNTTEMLFAIGAGGQVIAVSQYSNWPRAARTLPRIGGAGSIDIERIVALRPDLIVAWGSGISASVRQRFRQLGLPLFASEPHRLRDVSNDMQALGVLTGHQSIAKEAVRRFQSSVRMLRQRYHHKSSVSVFYQIWQQPLMTIGGTHFIDSVIRLCGGKNIFAHRSSASFSVSLESVLAARPQVILGARARIHGLRRFWGKWSDVPAVADGQIYGVADDLIDRPGPRLAEGAAHVCADIDRARRRIGR